MATAKEDGTETELSGDERSPTDSVAGIGGAATNSNDKYAPSGQKSSDRTIGQYDEHYSWRQVYRLCEVEHYGHE